MCCVRIMTNNASEYRQVKIHRKRKSNQDNVGKKNEKKREKEILIEIK